MKNHTASDSGHEPTSVNSPRPPWITRTWRTLRPFLIAYLIIMLGMVLLETRLVYPIPPLTRGNWHPTSFPYETAEFASADGTKLHGWYFPHPDSKRAILYCHGNGEDVANNGDLGYHLSNVLQASVLVFDYRGYGNSKGSPTEAGCIADGTAAQTWLAERVGIEPNEVVLMGRSIGSAVAVALAADNGCQALILENSMPSIVSVAALQYPWLPVKWIMRNRYDNLERIQRYTGPLWQTHGTADTLIPIASARSLFDAAPSKNKTWVEYPNSDHNDPPPRRYYADLKTFLDSLPTSQTTASPALK